MSSYKDIAKATSLIGFVQIIQIIFGIIRNKCVALFVGTYGFGIWALYNSYIEMVTQFSMLGLDKSGVRQISKDVDASKIAKTIFIFRKTLLIISLFTAGCSMLLSKTISQILFNTQDYFWGVIIVSFVILFNGLSNGQKSILNGLRDLRGLSISQIIGSITGSVTAIISVYFLGIKGIPIFIFIVGLTAVLCTWWYTKKLKIENISPTTSEFKTELYSLLKIGLGFSIAGIIATLMTYASRVYLTRHFNIEAVGIYQASWTISNLYIGMILGAMGVDLMPRLMKVIKNNSDTNNLLNEQMEFGVTISSIGVIGILIFSPIILELFYSQEFAKGVSIIRWQVLGVSLRVLAFPFSHAIMAKEKSGNYIFIQVIFWVTDFILLIGFSSIFGFNGLGINYCIAYVLYYILAWIVCVKIFNFKPSRLLILLMSISYLFIFSAFFVYYLTAPYNYIIGSIILAVNIIWTLIVLNNKMKINIIQIIKNKWDSKTKFN